MPDERTHSLPSNLTTGPDATAAPAPDATGPLHAAHPPHGAEVPVNRFPYLSPPRAAGELGRLGKYRVVGVLGAGGMGTVFRAEDPVLRRHVALKVMLPRLAADPQARARFVREARAQAQVEHDHVIPIFEIEPTGTPFFVMPLLKGMTLTAALKANPRPPLAAVVRVGREVAVGLAAAHEKGLVHRDVKPSNVWSSPSVGG